MRLYLDIDGVITADPDSFDGVRTFIVDNAIVDWVPELFYTLIGDYSEVVWATSWILPPSSLDLLEEMIDVKFDRVNLTWDNYLRSSLTCGKLTAVREHYEADPAPFVWIDDHAGPDDRAWVEQVGGHLIVPSYETGGAYSMMMEYP